MNCPGLLILAAGGLLAALVVYALRWLGRAGLAILHAIDDMFR